MRYNQQPNPDIAIPSNDPNELTNSIRREWAAYKVLMIRGAVDALAEAGQCMSNVDSLLDHYPIGQPRDIWAGRLILGEN